MAKMLGSDRNRQLSVDPERREGFSSSVSNGSGPSFWVRVRVRTEPLSNWQSGLLIHLNCNLGPVGCKCPDPSELGRLSAGRPADPSVDLYNVHVLAVGEVCSMKVRYSTAKNLFLHVLQSATLIILVYLSFLSYVAFLAIEADNSSVMSSFICTKPWLHNIQEQILLTLRWRSVAWSGKVCVVHCFKWIGSHDTVYESLPHFDT